MRADGDVELGEPAGGGRGDDGDGWLRGGDSGEGRKESEGELPRVGGGKRNESLRTIPGDFGREGGMAMAEEATSDGWLVDISCTFDVLADSVAAAGRPLAAACCARRLAAASARFARGLMVGGLAEAGEDGGKADEGE